MELPSIIQFTGFTQKKNVKESFRKIKSMYLQQTTEDEEEEDKCEREKNEK